MVFRPGGLVDFTLKSKELALKFAKTLNKLESVKTATAHADTVVEVRIDFIPPGFPSEPILEYLTYNHGEILETSLRISNRYNIQTGTKVFRMDREKLKQNPIPLFISANTNLEPVTKNNIPSVAAEQKLTTSKENAQIKQT